MLASGQCFEMDDGTYALLSLSSWAIAAGLMKTEQQPVGAGAPNRSLYRGQGVALLTQHGKERVIAPVLAAAVGCLVERVTGYDTDLLGTFTRDIPRPGTRLEAARAKARIGMNLSGRSLGLGSEGSFGLDPYAGMFPWNVELVLFIDDALGIEVIGVAQGKANSAQLLSADWGEIEAFARTVGFPEHHLVLRPEGPADTRIRKGVSDWPELKDTYAWAASQSVSGKVFMEVDLRAYANPVRLTLISQAAADLGRRLGSLCPICNAPGFWVIESLPGLLCQACRSPTRQIRAEIHGCLKCEYRVTREHTDREYADPGQCDVCNP